MNHPSRSLRFDELQIMFHDDVSNNNLYESCCVISSWDILPLVLDLNLGRGDVKRTKPFFYTLQSERNVKTSYLRWFWLLKDG
jgi:hypothetical protein